MRGKDVGYALIAVGAFLSIASVAAPTIGDGGGGGTPQINCNPVDETSQPVGSFKDLFCYTRLGVPAIGWMIAGVLLIVTDGLIFYVGSSAIAATPALLPIAILPGIIGVYLILFGLAPVTTETMIAVSYMFPLLFFVFKSTTGLEFPG